MTLAPDLAKLLACPLCKGRLQEVPGYLLCGACRVRYPVSEGIPRLLAEAAEKLPGEEL